MSKLGKYFRWMAGGGCEALVHWCPGCESVHVIYLRYDNKPSWTWNGDIEKPTVDPSVALSNNKRGRFCHYNIRDGKIVFADDCKHALNRQTVDLPPWPYQPGEYGGVED